MVDAGKSYLSVSTAFAVQTICNSEYFDLITMFRLRTISALVGLAALSMQVSEPS